MAEEKAEKKKAGFLLPSLIIVLSVLVVGGIVVYLNYTNFAKIAIEKMATKTLGVNVTIASLDIDISNMKADVGGLKIANPQGYSKPHVITVDSISIDLKGVTKELATFDNISVTGTTINLEVMENGTNLTAIRNNVDSKASAKEVKAEGGEEKPPVKVVITELLINNATLNPSSTLTGGDLASVTLPDIILRGIGQKQNGVLASEAIAQILNYVTKVAVNAAAKAGFLEGMNIESLKAMQSSLGLSSGFVDKAKEDLQELGKGLKGLLGK